MALGRGEEKNREGDLNTLPWSLSFPISLEANAGPAPGPETIHGLWGVSDVLLSLEIPSSAQGLTSGGPCLTCHKFTRNNRSYPAHEGFRMDLLEAR